ncbi:unnamed protein product, partial [marine sediment metagenome]
NVRRYVLNAIWGYILELIKELSPQCTVFTIHGIQCKNRVTDGSNKCWAHQKQAIDMNNKKLINDIEKFKKHILSMSPKEFETMIKENENGDIAKLLMGANAQLLTEQAGAGEPQKDAAP